MSATARPGTSSVPGRAAVHEGFPLLQTLATALIKLDGQTDLDGFTLPYPDEAQRALDRTVQLFLLRGAAPPQSLADLVERCHQRPVSHWPLGLPPDVVGPEDRLLDPVSGRPTDLCHEWARDTKDSAAEFYDRWVIERAMRLCREYGEEDTYSAFRGLLVECPVLTAMEDFKVSGDLVLEPVRELLTEIYQPVPASYLRDGRYAVCGRCLTLLTPVRDGEWWCERDRCRRQGPPPIGRVLSPEADGPILQLDRPLRQFVTGPGRAETDLARALTALGLKVRMWPGFDAYDLHVTFPDGGVWAIDVKDWAHPGLLGRAARPVRRDPPYDEAFWVVPEHRIADRPAYIEIYERNRPAEAEGLRLLTDRQLRQQARRRLRALRKDHDA